MIEMKCPHFPKATAVEIVGDERFLFILKRCNVEVETILSSAKNIEDVLVNVEETVSQIERSHGFQDGEYKSMAAINDTILAVENIHEQLQEIGFDKVVELDAAVTRVVLWSPEHGAAHQLQLLLPPDYPRTAASPRHQLPAAWQPPPGPGTISHLYRGWVAALELYSPAWRQLAELDRLCWVLDPEPASSLHLHRRLVVTTAVTLHLELDPAAPTSIPVLRFLGPDHRVSPLRACLAANSELWDEEEPLLTNLERALELELPARTAAAAEETDWEVECGICYLYMLGEAVPSVSCSSARCSASYHASCLHEWLASCPGARTSLNMVTGECPAPHCQVSIQAARPAQTADL